MMIKNLFIDKYKENELSINFFSNKKSESLIQKYTSISIHNQDCCLNMSNIIPNIFLASLVSLLNIVRAST